MTTTTINLTTVSIQAARPSYSYGTGIPYPPIEYTKAVLLIQASLPSIPTNAIVKVAEVRFNQAGVWSGTNTVTVRRNAAAWTTKVRWDNRPAQTGTIYSASKTSSVPGISWAVNVASDVQAFVNRSAKNYGWMLGVNTPGKKKVRGQASPDAKPYLYLEWEVPAVAPVGLSPDGAAVDLDKPVLTLQPPSGATAMEIHIDPARSATPAWGSGEVPVDSAFDLAATSYPGLSSGTTYWRARAKSATGWGPFSAWASFSRVAVGTLTITSPPGGTTADPTPPTHWAFTGNQTAWQARLLDSTGRVVSDSGIRGGTATEWTPTVALGSNGATGAVQVRVWDDQLRTATPGRPEYVQETRELTVALSGAVTPMTSLQAAPDGFRPVVTLTGVRSAGAPDEVVVFRRPVGGAEQQVARLSNADCFTGTTFSWQDWSAPCAGPVTYRVAPVVNGAVASGGPEATVTPKCQGLWLVEETDSANPRALVVWDVDTGSISRDDMATVHSPVNGSWVRRRVANLPASGSAAGMVTTALGIDAASSLATIEYFRLLDAGTRYRYVAGHLNLRVVAGDFTSAPDPLSTSGDVVARVAWNWWEVA